MYVSRDRLFCSDVEANASTTTVMLDFMFSQGKWPSSCLGVVDKLAAKQDEIDNGQRCKGLDILKAV